MLYLRDAGVLLETERQDFLQRLALSERRAKANGIGLQITLGFDFLTALNRTACNAVIRSLATFDSALVHLHTNGRHRFGNNSFSSAARTVIEHIINACDTIAGLCVHPDLVDDYMFFERFAGDGRYVGVECLDSRAGTGNRLTDIADIVTEYDFMSVVVDTAHVQEMQHFGEPGISHYIDFFGGRIKEFHVSQNGNYYNRALVPPGFDTSHSLLCLNSNSILQNILAAPHGSTHYVIEGVVPCGSYGTRLLQQEVSLLQSDLACHAQRLHTVSL